MSEKKLIFTITTGRSGTGLLSQLLDTLPQDQVFVGHEVKPLFDDYLGRIRNGGLTFGDFWSNIKLPAIYEKPQPVYIETAHTISKGFIDSLLEFDQDVKFIWLQRSLRETASSMYRLGDIPGVTRTGVRYYLLPDEHRSIPVPSTATDYQRCYLYCKEIWERGRYYREKLGDDMVFPISLGQIRMPGYFQELLSWAGLPNPESMAEFTRRTNIKVNQKLGRKIRPLAMNLDEQERGCTYL